jgi:G3E family GTPase
LVQNLPVPVNIITGHLSAGKTTLVSSLLSRKPGDEHWSVLVNEIGSLGIDAALLQGTTDSALGA